jgi:hypothetical protein
MTTSGVSSRILSNAAMPSPASLIIVPTSFVVYLFCPPRRYPRQQ